MQTERLDFDKYGQYGIINIVLIRSLLLLKCSSKVI